MPAMSKAERIQLWIDRMNRFSSSSMTVAEFCAAEGISAPSFYQWKRRLSPRIDVPRNSKRSRSAQRPPGDSPAGDEPRGFTELVVTDSTANNAKIILPGNIEVQLGSQRDLATALVREVLRHACESPSGADQC